MLDVCAHVLSLSEIKQKYPALSCCFMQQLLQATALRLQLALVFRHDFQVTCNP